MAQRRRAEIVEHPIPIEPHLLPKRYCGQSHPVIASPQFCDACRLGMKQALRNNQNEQQGNVVVPGAGPDDLTKVKLIIISDHPGLYESEPSRGYPMFDNRLRERRDSDTDIAQRMNAGALMRDCLAGVFGLDSYTDVWTTNAVRCNPQEQTIQAEHLKICATTWGRAEIAALDEYCPDAPILAAGSHAFRVLQHLYPVDWVRLKDLGWSSCRRRRDLRVGATKRPLVVTVNPAAAARGDMMVETQVMPGSGGIRITAAEPLRPVIEGSPLWMFLNDIAILKDFL